MADDRTNDRMNDQKDIVYIDVEDEITAVIDKLQSSPKKIVALVLPKRAAVFQSVVNMKLLKRVADESKKHVVLVSSESALMPLAGAVGLHVARTPQSKPEIPPTPSATREQAGGDEPDRSAPVGDLSDQPEDDDPIQVDNSEAPLATADKKGKKSKDAGAKKAGKRLKIPNFEKFRTKLLLGAVGLVILIVGWVMAFVVMPKATITLKTDTSNLDTNLTIIADPAAESLDQEAGIVPAISKEFRKTDTEKVAATGEKDKGTSASGSVTLSVDCAGGTPTIPAGTSVSTDNLAFTTESEVTIASFPDNSNGSCQFRKAVDVAAQKPGAQYNVAAGKDFIVAGYSSVTGTNDAAMTGGTSKIVKIITQDDVNKAKDAITKRTGSEGADDLKEDIKKEGSYPIAETLNANTPVVTSEPNVGDEASEVTVTSTTVFTMLGVKEDDLKKLIEEDARKRIDTSKQVIRDNGLAAATIQVEKKGAGGQMTLSLQATVVAGPDLNEDAIKNEVVGKKRGDIQNLLKGRPGINEVEVSYSPFWVQSTPKSTSKITIIFENKDNGSNTNENP
ncbi:MAG TPA: hypothetical protein VK674_06355 [Candidatus Limnocylindria bacterium]|nr:hypothetical protein [Candidatus Limnocylindria bacterium]